MDQLAGVPTCRARSRHRRRRHLGPTNGAPSSHVVDEVEGNQFVATVRQPCGERAVRAAGLARPPVPLTWQARHRHRALPALIPPSSYQDRIRQLSPTCSTWPTPRLGGRHLDVVDAGTVADRFQQGATLVLPRQRCEACVRREQHRRRRPLQHGHIGSLVGLAQLTGAGLGTLDVVTTSRYERRWRSRSQPRKSTVSGW